MRRGIGGVVVAVVAALVGVTGCTVSDPGSGAASTSQSRSAPPPASPIVTAPATARATTGCAPNGVRVPAGATTATIPDVDGDGRDDTEFSVESGRFAYGIHTASGATVSLRYDLAGPGVHSGWTVALRDGLSATVLDDGRTASLHGFVDCRFTTPVGTDGKPYTFTLNGFGEYGTGVECSAPASAADRTISGMLATRRSDGRYTITATTVVLSTDGRTATNGSKRSIGSTFAASSAAVSAATRSGCAGVPRVHTSGR